MDYLRQNVNNRDIEEKIKDVMKEGLDIKNIEKKLEELNETSNLEFLDNAEVNTPVILLNKIKSKLPNNFWENNPTILDYSCGKGNIIVMIFLEYFSILNNTINDRCKVCKIILEEKLYLGDINIKNIYITISKLHYLAKYLTNNEIEYKYNYYIGDSLKLNLNTKWGISKIDRIVVNPPFEDRNKRNTTPHKLWIDFTKLTFKEWLKVGGILVQISPSSFSSPSSKILNIFKEKKIIRLYLNESNYFKNVNTTISWYIIENVEDDDSITLINDDYSIKLNNDILYLPNDVSDNINALSIHKKVMFNTTNKLDVKRDYVTAHNILLKGLKLKEGEKITLSKEKTDYHIYPVKHTNKQTWYSSIKQSFLDSKKVMWSRSGYTIPFYDNGTLGITDLCYYVLVENEEEGNNLVFNLKSELFNYILKTAKWSGIGNDKVFYNLPKLPNKKLTNDELYSYFSLEENEINYLREYFS